MLINQLNLNNFGIYAGYHEIDLSPSDPEKPIILFGGLNGGGKTTLLEALLLALYGKLAETNRRKNKAYGDYLESLINKYSTKLEGASVEVLFLDSETGSEYRIFRQWSKKGQSVRESLQVFVDGRLDVGMAEAWDEEVDRFLPQKLCNLFFFDGEQIERLADPEESKDILNTAISGLLGINLVDQACSDLAILQRRMADRADSSVDGVIKEMRERHEWLGHQIAQKYAELDARSSELAEVKRLIEQVERKFKRGGGGILERLTELESDLKEARSKFDSAELELRALAGSALPLSILHDKLCDLAEVAASERQLDVAENRSSVLEESQERLIAHLNKHKTAKSTRNLVEAWFEVELANTRVDRCDKWLNAPYGLVERLIDLIDQELPNSIELSTERLTYINETAEKMLRFERQIQNAPEQESVEAIIKERAAFHSRAGELKLSLEQSRREIERVEMERSALAAKLRKLHNDSIDSEVERRSLIVADALREGLQRFKAKVIERHLARIEELIVDSYAQLLRKKSLVSRVSIDPTSLELSVLDHQGHRVLSESLSAGERQLLATSILWALAKASGRGLPVVIDTPLGRLDSTHREKLVQNYFPSASMQVIILSTDEEIDARHVAELEPFISRKYTIEYDEDRGGSVIRKGYAFGEAA